MPMTYVRPPQRGGPSRRLHRSGRLLVEMLVAMVLVAIGTSASVELVRANLALTDRVAFLASSRIATRTVAEELQVTACFADAGAEQAGRTEITWTPSVSGSLVSIALSARRAPLPAGPAPPRPLTAELAGWCP